MTREQKCRVCGCTNNDCRVCVEKTGEPCHWVEINPDLCSACVPVPAVDLLDREVLRGIFEEAEKYAFNFKGMETHFLLPDDVPTEDCLARVLVDLVNKIAEKPFETVPATDAIYGFAAWLTTREEAVMLGSCADAAPVVPLVVEYLGLLGLSDTPSERYPDTIAPRKKKHD